MELRDLLSALQRELREAGLSTDGATASLAFVAKRERDGTISVDFVDAASMSKPRPEELHRVEVELDARPVAEVSVNDPGPLPKQSTVTRKSGETIDHPRSPQRESKPPTLPPRRQ